MIFAPPETRGSAKFVESSPVERELKEDSRRVDELRNSRNGLCDGKGLEHEEAVRHSP